MICPSCNREMDKETVRYHTPSGYERKLVVFECPYDSCYGQDFTEDEIKIAALTTRLQEAEAIIKPIAEHAGKLSGMTFPAGTTEVAHFITVEQFTRAAAWLKGGTE